MGYGFLKHQAAYSLMYYALQEQNYLETGIPKDKVINFSIDIGFLIVPWL